MLLMGSSVRRHCQQAASAPSAAYGQHAPV